MMLRVRDRWDSLSLRDWMGTQKTGLLLDIQHFIRQAVPEGQHKKNVLPRICPESGLGLLTRLFGASSERVRIRDEG